MNIRTIVGRMPGVGAHPRLALGIGLAGLAVGWMLLPEPGRSRDGGADPVYVSVQRGPLTIGIDEGGTIVSRERFTVATELSEDTTFLWLIKEGSMVQAGDLLAELDATYFTDRKSELDIALMANQSSLARAENEYKVALNENEAEVSQAEVDYRLAELELLKFSEGDVPQRLLELETAISIAREELKRAEDMLDGSRKLRERGFITGSELQADMLTATRAQINLQLAEGAQQIYKTYTHQTELETRTTDLEQKRLTLERVRHQAASREQFAETNLANERAQLHRRETRLRQLEQDIANCRLVAPADGMVIYASTVRDGRHYREPFAAGREVDERQDVFYIPSSGLRNAEFAVHESHLEMVATGMLARVRVEAIPHAEFPGELTQIAMMPRQDEEWLNPNLKAFRAEVALNTDDERLRTGMSCQVEVIVHRYPDALSVPVQAVTRRQGQPCVYVRTRGQPECRPVRVGLSDHRKTAILEGLTAGEEVLLSPPLATDHSLPPPPADHET